VQYSCNSGLLRVDAVDDAIRSSMKLGKAPGVVTAEHIVYAHPAIVIHLTKLFNAMIAHGYVPNYFGTSIIVPLVKDRCGDVSKLANYRAISLSPVFAKLLEACLSGKFGVLLCTAL